MRNNKFVDTAHMMYLYHEKIFLYTLNNFDSPEYGVSLMRMDGTESFFAFDKPEKAVEAYRIFKEITKFEETEKLKNKKYFMWKIFKDVINIPICIVLLLCFFLNKNSSVLFYVFMIIMFLMAFNFGLLFNMIIKVMRKTKSRDYIEQELDRIGLIFLENDFSDIKDISFYIKNFKYSDNKSE